MSGVERDVWDGEVSRQEECSDNRSGRRRNEGVIGVCVLSAFYAFCPFVLLKCKSERK